MVGGGGWSVVAMGMAALAVLTGCVEPPPTPLAPFASSSATEPKSAPKGSTTLEILKENV